MKRRDSARNESFASSFTPKDPSGQINLFVLTLSYPGGTDESAMSAARRKVRAFPVLDFRDRPHASEACGYLLSPAGRKRRGEGPVVHPAAAGCRLVGHPVGADLHHPVRLQQFMRRQRRHAGSGQFAAGASHARAGRFPDSVQELNARSSARPPHRVNYRPDIVDGGQGMGLRKPKNIKHNGKSLADILEAHQRFFSGKDGGVRAELTGADLSHTDLSGTNLSGTILRNANLEGSDLRKAKLPGADLSGANLRKADLRNSDMTEAILPVADLTEAQASGVEFFRCDLSNVNFQRAHLRNVNLRLANVKGAKFSGADMGVAILRETDLTGADLSGVDLSTTLLPKGFSARERVLELIRGLLEELGSQGALPMLNAASQLDRDLGLGSLERVELLARLETAFD